MKFYRTEGCQYISHGGLISNSNGNMGSYTDTVYTLSSGVFSRIFNGTREMDMNTGELSYFISGSQVQEGEYYSVLGDKFNFGNGKKLSYSSSSTYENIKAQIHNY